MKFISTRTHGALDYIFGLLLIGLPWFLGNGGTGPESLTPTLIGLFTIATATMTDYENSLLNLIPMKIHLTIDFMTALFLGASPWIFQFEDKTYLPFVFFAAFEIIVVLFSKHTRNRDSGKENLI